MKIPNSLIEKLKPFGPRFIKVAKPIPGDPKSGKQAVEHAWQEHPYEAEDPEMQSWLEAGGNYGVVCGQGIIEIDIDKKETRETFESRVNTFTVKSGRLSGEGRHCYCRSDVTENGTILGPSDKEGKRENLANVQAHHKYVVGPGCNHNSGGTYEIVKDVPLAWVSKADLEDIFGKCLVWSGEKSKIVEDQAQEERDLIGFDIPIREIIPEFEELRQISANEFQGAHPVHGSTTGVNFCVNVQKNCWHCFRCNSGGGPLSWLAVKHRLITCDQSQKGVLKGDLFLKTLELARKEGYEISFGEEEEEIIEPNVAKYFEGKPPHFVPPYLARELMKRFHYVTREEDELIFLYHANKGIYTPNGEAHIKRQVEKCLGKHFRTTRQREVISYIISSTLQEVNDAPLKLIALKNGIFNTETGELEPFNLGYFILNALPLKHDPQADCPKIKKFVSEVVNAEDIPVLQEIAGYCLYRGYIIHKAVMLVGEGANGKSTFMEILRAMLGQKNVSTVPVQELESNRFAVCSLYGKLANIYPDLSDKALRSTGTFKMLTGGDTISAEYKFKDKFQFRNYAKLIFSANKVPESPDDTTAFFRRWIIVNFPNQFLDGDPKTDKDLVEKLTAEEELSGFFNWALEGLRRLLKNGRFSTGKSVEETREQYIRASDPVKAFAMDCIEHKAGNIVPKDEVYAAFIQYCQEMRLPTIPKNAFSMRLPQYLPNLQSERKKVGKQYVWYWRDIRLLLSGAKSSLSTGLPITVQDSGNSIEQRVTVEEPSVETEDFADKHVTLEDFDELAEGEDSKLEDE